MQMSEMQSWMQRSHSQLWRFRELNDVKQRCPSQTKCIMMASSASCERDEPAQCNQLPGYALHSRPCLYKWPYQLKLAESHRSLRVCLLVFLCVRPDTVTHTVTFQWKQTSAKKVTEGSPHSSNLISDRALGYFSICYNTAPKRTTSHISCHTDIAQVASA